MNNYLLKLTNGEFVHDELEFRCFKLKYSIESDNFAPAGINLVPLWESDSSITGFYNDEHDAPCFIHYYIDGLDSYRTIGKTLTDLVNFLVEEYVDYEFEAEVRDLLLTK